MNLYQSLSAYISLCSSLPRQFFAVFRGIFNALIFFKKSKVISSQCFFNEFGRTVHIVLKLQKIVQEKYGYGKNMDMKYGYEKYGYGKIQQSSNE